MGVGFEKTFLRGADCLVRGSFVIGILVGSYIVGEVNIRDQYVNNEQCNAEVYFIRFPFKNKPRRNG